MSIYASHLHVLHIPDPNRGVVWHHWCVYTPPDRVLTDRQFGLAGEGGCAAGMVIFPLSIRQVYLSFVPACMGKGGTVQVRGSGLQYKQNLG